MAQLTIELRLPSFDGSLSLLVHAVEQRELDIAAFSLSQIARQCLSQLRSEPELDPVALADFIALGATLLLLKSRRLLPARPEPERQSDVEVEDLERMATEYRRFHAVATALQDRDDASVRAFRRSAPPPLPVVDDWCSNEPMLATQLLNLFIQALARDVEEPPQTFVAEVLSVRDKIDQVLEALRNLGRLAFRALLASCSTRLEIVVSFIAVLHLVKDGMVTAVQSEPFGDILLERSFSH